MLVVRSSSLSCLRLLPRCHFIGMMMNEYDDYDSIMYVQSCNVTCMIMIVSLSGMDLGHIIAHVVLFLLLLQ
jgi:hypothetical protein